MATIQIRDIPEEAYETIRKRARSAGMSLQAYMREEVVRMASRRTKEEALAAVEAALAHDRGAGVTVESILAAKDADRR
ncbi:FitA-like ribbon-helix-helix domain-containing protein [Saccharopolyspora sp. NPDC000995]